MLVDVEPIDVTDLDLATGMCGLLLFSASWWLPLLNKEPLKFLKISFASAIVAFAIVDGYNEDECADDDCELLMVSVLV